MFRLSLIAAALAAGSIHARAGMISLADFAYNSDGTVDSTVTPGSTFDTTTGLGTFRLRISSAGVHSGLLFVDHELSEALNGFDNELGEPVGAPSAGLSWEIDEPGWSAVPGDIYPNFESDTLDNSVGKSSPDDVSMALGWKFVLQPGETGILEFLLGTDRPSSFHLRQFDPDSGDQVYFSGSLSIVTLVPDEGGGTSAIALAALALAARWGATRNRFGGNEPR